SRRHMRFSRDWSSYVCSSDLFPIPLASGQRAFHQSDGERIVPPYRAHGKTSNAAMIAGTPHDFADTQAAWNQGKYGYWPLFKTRSEEHTSELQSRENLVCRLL